jgi:hypothetical protein
VTTGISVEGSSCLTPSAILATASIRMISGLLLERRHAVELGASVELSSDFLMWESCIAFKGDDNNFREIHCFIAKNGEYARRMLGVTG